MTRRSKLPSRARWESRGDYLICGSRLDNELGNQAGAAYVFERTPGGAWLEVQKLLASDGEPKDLFGESVAIDGTTAIVGAYFKDGVAGTKTGAAFVFERQASKWVEVQKLEASDQESSAEFGRSVAIEGERIVVGARYDGVAGAAYVFDKEPGGWVEVAKLTPSDGESGDEFGESCDVAGDVVMIGARRAHPPVESGLAYLFEKQGSEWVQLPRLVPSGVGSTHKFGTRVGISDDIAVGGSPLALGYDGTATIFSVSDECPEPPAIVAYGSGVNPADSLVHLAGTSAIGTFLTVGVDNPLGTQGAGSFAGLMISLVPDPNFPTGTLLPGLGMSAPGAVGELLVGLPTFLLLLGPAWSGPGCLPLWRSSSPGSHSWRVFPSTSRD